MIKFNLLKVEGLGDLSQAECLVFVDEELVSQSCDLLAFGVTLNPFRNSVRFVVLDRPSGLLISSLQFFSDIFEQPGLTWLPLFLSDENLIREIPENVQGPRVLLDVQMELMQEHLVFTESSESIEDFSLSKQKEENSVHPEVIGLRIKLTELENSLNLVKRNSEVELEEVVRKSKEKIMKLKQRLVKSSAFLMEKEEKFESAVKEIHRLKESLEKMRKEKKDLEEKVEKFERLSETFYNSLQVDKSRMFLENNKKNLQIFRESEVFIIPSYPIQEKSQEIYNLSSKLVEIEKKLKKYSNFERIEKKLQNILHSLNVEGLLKLSDEAVYIIGNKKINLVLKKDSLQVRCGGYLKTFEAYIANCCSQDIQNFLKSRNSKESSPVKSNSRSNNGFDCEKIQNSVINKSFELDFKVPLHKTRSKIINKLKLFEPLAQSLSSRHM
jgi:hypothetical protein